MTDYPRDENLGILLVVTIVLRNGSSKNVCRHQVLCTELNVQS